MPEQWRKRSRQAFRFWHQLLATWDNTSGASDRFGTLIAHLKRFEKRSAETFKHVIERGPDPVYILHVLIVLCDETRVRHAGGLPQVMTEENMKIHKALQEIRAQHRHAADRFASRRLMLTLDTSHVMDKAEAHKILREQLAWFTGRGHA